MINQNLSETSSYEQDTDYTILHHVNKACVMVLFTTECWIKKKLDFKQTKFSKSYHDHVILSFHDYIWKNALHSLKFLLKSRFFLFSSTLNSAWKSQAVAIAYNFFANIIGLDIVIFSSLTYVTTATRLHSKYYSSRNCPFFISNHSESNYKLKRINDNTL